MAPYVEYVATITFLGKPDPDDPRSLGEQADEQIEALGWFLGDLGAHLEVLRRCAVGEGPHDGLVRRSLDRHGIPGEGPPDDAEHTSQ